MQQRRIDACINLPANHPLQPPMIEPIQFVPADAEGAVDHVGSDSANIDVSSSHPNSPTKTTETHEPSVIQGLINHYSGELPGYQSNLEKASDIISNEVMTEIPHQQTPNPEMTSSTNADYVVISDNIHPEPDIPEQDVPELSVPKQPCGLLMFNFRFLTSQTSINKLCNITFQPGPPKQSLQVMIHLCSSRMNT